MVQLEEKTTAELASLKEKIAHMEADMEVFSDLAALERQEEERREVTHACTHHLAVCALAVSLTDSLAVLYAVCSACLV